MTIRDGKMIFPVLFVLKKYKNENKSIKMKY